MAEVVQGHGGAPPKSLDSDKNFKPEHTLFCRKLRFVTIYALFGDLWAKKCLLGQKQCFLGKKCTITWYILHISVSYFCKFAITRKNDAFVAKIVNTCLTKIFMAIFVPDERLPSSATLCSLDYSFTLVNHLPSKPILQWSEFLDDVSIVFANEQ